MRANNFKIELKSNGYLSYFDIRRPTYLKAITTTTGVVTTEDFEDDNFTAVVENEGAEPELELHTPDLGVIDTVEVDDNMIVFTMPEKEENITSELEIKSEGENEVERELKTKINRRGTRSTAGKTLRFVNYGQPKKIVWAY